jgi:hypothetical protein
VIAAGHRIVTLLSQNPMMYRDRDSLEQEDAAAFLKALPGRVDWLVVAHVALGAVWESAMRPAACRILAVDTLARQHDCDIVFDQTQEALWTAIKISTLPRPRRSMCLAT